MATYPSYLLPQQPSSPMCVICNILEQLSMLSYLGTSVSRMFHQNKPNINLIPITCIQFYDVQTKNKGKPMWVNIRLFALQREGVGSSRRIGKGKIIEKAVNSWGLRPCTCDQLYLPPHIICMSFMAGIIYLFLFYPWKVIQSAKYKNKQSTTNNIHWQSKSYINL